ncbi:MAG: outer membrane protein transport protein [Halioglobus sp.]|nr:outer membrane protein transport protein [Halioglobus sp.]
MKNRRASSLYRRYLIPGAGVVLSASIISPALGAGFAILEQSPKANGTALAGSGSSARDASAVWFNPAAMSLLDHELLVAGHQVVPTFEYTDEGSTQQLADGSVPLLPEASATRSGDKNAFIPHLSYVHRLDDRWHFGVTLNAPFGLTIDYGRDWKGQYQAVLSEIVNFNLNPALSYRVTDSLVIGAGFSVNYVDVELSNALDFAAICVEVVGGDCPNGAVPGRGQFDGFVSNAGDSTSVGANVGLLWEIGEATRLGLTYRSEIDHEIEGTADFTTPGTLGGLDALGPFLGGALSSAFADSDIGAALTLPASGGVSFYHRLAADRRFAIMADAEWTGWSSVRRLRIEFDNTATPASEVALRWEDVWRFSLGVEFNAGDRWTWRAGAAFDETPTDEDLTTARLPGNDRIWLAAGATWRWMPRSEIDVALAHTFVDDTDIDRVGDTGDRLRGRYQADATMLSLALTYRF